VDPRIEREQAYARNPDQPLPSKGAPHPTSKSALAPSPSLPARRGFGHGRPVPALLKKRTPEPEKI
jgi:hypothetical protein